ncbi:hypothetical protein [Methylibium petroleiphilum]|uniref:hypothetical protein n=1 Tax=Methylibium petroleiphilum TaxID=105560 RepID=UPI003D27C9CF
MFVPRMELADVISTVRKVKLDHPGVISFQSYVDDAAIDLYRVFGCASPLRFLVRWPDGPVAVIALQPGDDLAQALMRAYTRAREQLEAAVFALTPPEGNA